jgi:hypothetical protein
MYDTSTTNPRGKATQETRTESNLETTHHETIIIMLATLMKILKFIVIAFANTNNKNKNMVVSVSVSLLLGALMGVAALLV